MLKTVINSLFICRHFIVDGGVAVILHLGKYSICKHVTLFYSQRNTGMRNIATFQSTDRIYSGGPIKLYYDNTYHCITIAYSIQYSNMLYRFVA